MTQEEKVTFLALRGWEFTPQRQWVRLVVDGKRLINYGGFGWFTIDEAYRFEMGDALTVEWKAWSLE